MVGRLLPPRWVSYCRCGGAAIGVTVGRLLPLRWADYCRYGGLAIGLAVLPLRWASYCRYGGAAIAVTVPLRWAGYCRYGGLAIAVTVGRLLPTKSQGAFLPTPPHPTLLVSSHPPHPRPPEPV